MNSIRHDLEEAKLSKSHIRIMLISGMSFFTDAYDLFVIGVVLLMLRQVFSLTPAEMGYVASAALFGAVIGPILFGKLADKYGRKHAYWITISILIVGAIGSALSFNPVELIFWRFILGLGIGGDYPLSSTIVAEYANRNDRGKLIASTFAMQGFGIATGIVVAFLLLYANTPESIAWRILLGLGAIPSILIFYFRLKFRETPLYEIFKGRLSSAKLTVQELASGKSFGSADFIPATTLTEFARKYPGVVIGTAAAWFIMDISYYGTGIFTPYLATIFGFKGTFAAVKVASLLMLSMAVPGYWLAVALIDKEGRKAIQAVGFLIVGLIFIVLALFGNALFKFSPFLFFFAYGLTFLFTNYGPNTTTYVYPTELYPTSIRATGHGIASTSGKLGAAISTLIFPTLLSSIGEFALIGILGAISIVGFIITVLLLPETKRRPLSETSGEESLMLIAYALQDKFRNHIEYINKATRLLKEMVNRDDNADYFKRIKQYEHYADREIREIYDIILNSRPTSTAYVDVSHLASRLDNVIDGIEKVASRMVIYDTKPNKTIRKFVEGIEKSVRIIGESFEMLIRLSLNSSLLKDERNRLRAMATKYENEGDALLRSSLAELAKKRNAMEMLEYKDVYESLEEVTDRCIDVLDVMSDISLRYIQDRSRNR